MVFEIWFRVRDHFTFSPREIKEITFSALIFGFILSFRRWGGESFDINAGLVSWSIAFFFILITMFWSISWNKIFALNDGFIPHYHWWFPSLLLGIMISFFTFGLVPFLYPGNMYYEHSKKLRLGRFRHGDNIKDFAVAGVAGVVSSIVLAMILSFIYIPTQNPLIKWFIIINFIYAFWNMMPIPRIAGTKLGSGATAGIYIAFFARPLYVFIFTSLILYSGLIYLAATAWASFWLLLVSALLGAVVMFLFLKFIAKVM